MEIISLKRVISKIFITMLFAFITRNDLPPVNRLAHINISLSPDEVSMLTCLKSSVRFSILSGTAAAASLSICDVLSSRLPVSSIVKSLSSAYFSSI
ncbi:MAG: hypothetical protein IJM40_01165 [Synergistaceae bacterium]|nr:hypothetical protein [Synergistaceae bacterium]